MLEEKLNSWKEIATYLKCDESTARRWERGSGLPVHRVGGSKGRSVYAYTEEVDAWLRGSRGSPEASEESLEESKEWKELAARRGQIDTGSDHHQQGTAADQADLKFPLHWKYAFAGAVVMGIAMTMWLALFGTSNHHLSKPTITSIDPLTPTRRNLDQTVTVKGNDFQDGMTVTVYYPGGIGRLSGTQLQDINPTSFEMVVLLGKIGDYSIVVNNPDGTHSNRFPFHVSQ
jgi:hypothetical protein